MTLGKRGYSTIGIVYEQGTGQPTNRGSSQPKQEVFLFIKVPRPSLGPT